MAIQMEFDNICVSHEADSKYSSSGLQNQETYCAAGNNRHNISYFLIPVMDRQAMKPLEAFRHVNHTFWTILPTVCCLAVARILTRKLQLDVTHNAVRFILEFTVIIVPGVLSVNVANNLVVYFAMLCILSLLLLILRTDCFTLASTRLFELGRHPEVLTLVRATISILTAICILAIDFKSFPKVFRKSRRYGAGLMDVGIGLFVFSMGTVARRPSRSTDLVKLVKVVIPILLLGLTRTLVITYIGYHQDEHEYGSHLNAFFTLGFAKLIGTLLSGVASTDFQLVPIGLGLLAVHESVLLLGVCDFVMDVDLERDTFLSANREGICSLPGFIAIYLISMYIGQVLQTRATLRFSEFIKKIKALAQMSAVLWVLVVLCIFSVGIARVTCNFGYATWILAIAVTITVILIFVFDLVLNTIWPMDTTWPLIEIGGEGDALHKTTVEQISNKHSALPSLIEAVNSNGLVFFLVANLLTGAVNIFLGPDDRTDGEGVIILIIYMLIASGFVYILYRLRIRIA